MAGISIPQLPRLKQAYFPENPDEKDISTALAAMQENFQIILLYLERLRNQMQDTIASIGE